MSRHCPQDGGFIGEGGCTHPHHTHSALVNSLLSQAEAASSPKLISTKQAESALKEGFYVTNPNGARVAFGEKLLSHLENDHLKGDANGRKTRLAFAIQAVLRPDKMELNHKKLEGRTLYVKAYDSFGIMAITDKTTNTIEEVFTIIPDRKGGKR